mgnify:CR=1 FL=1
MAKIVKGNKVKIEYTGTFEDGTVFDSSEKHGKPLEFEVGAGQVVPGFDQAVEGMEEGEEKEITIKPEEGYGEINPELKSVTLPVRSIQQIVAFQGTAAGVGETPVHFVSFLKVPAILFPIIACAFGSAEID